MGRFISLLIIIVTLFSAGLDVWAGAESHESSIAFSKTKQTTQNNSPDIKSAFYRGDVSLESNFTSNEDHDCHLGHCSFEIRSIEVAGNIVASRDDSDHANGFLPEEPTFYIPRPPAV